MDVCSIYIYIHNYTYIYIYVYLYVYIYIYFVEFNLLRNDDKCKTYAKTGPPFLLAQTFDMSNPGHKQSIEMLIASQVG